MNKTSIPRLFIGGTHSGCGKTSITMGLMGALCSKNIEVQGFKAGPDFIDPSFHTAVTNRGSRNLDTWMLSDEVNRSLLIRASEEAHIAIIEGVMGLFDGSSVGEQGSSAHLAKVTKTPVVLIIDGSGMAKSCAAIAFGFKELDPGVDVAGVIFNRVGSEGHFELLKRAVLEHTGLKVFGYLKKEEELTIPERHLGLQLHQEISSFQGICKKAADLVSTTVDLEGLLSAAKRAGDLCSSIDLFEDLEEGALSCRIGIAYDEAFSFYYQDNLDLLRAAGAKLLFFSPLKDRSLPENIDGLYIGGGYPELYAKELSENRDLNQIVKKRIEEGLPSYAECGGMIYLCQELVDHRGELYPMVGLIPRRVVMKDGLVALGYREVEAKDACYLLPTKERARGHEFHYAVMNEFEEERRIYRSIGRKGDRGYRAHSLLASWIHLHFATNPMIPRCFIRQAWEYRKREEMRRR